MYKALLIASTLAIATASFAETLTCAEQYQSLRNEKGIRKKTARRLGDALPLLFPATIYGEKESREARVLALIDENSVELSKMAVDKKKTIHADVTPSDIAQIVKEGMEQEIFCEEYMKTVPYKEVELYIDAKLREKYLLTEQDL